MQRVKKYYLVGGEVPSQYDGAYHYVSAHSLIRLYGLDPNECVLADRDRQPPPGVDVSKLLYLSPRISGNYKKDY